MSSETEQIIALKEVFEQAKLAHRSQSGRLLDLDLHGELQSALAQVGKKELTELKDEVYPYLNDVFWEFREAAVRALGSCNGLQLPEFRDLAHKIWLNDPNSNVKAAALDAWAGYYDGTKDPFVLKNLYHIFVSETYTTWIRIKALCGFMEVANELSSAAEISDIYRLDDLEDNKLVTKAIDWNKVHRIMKQNVPGWIKK